MKSIAFVLQKGGTGKTSVSVTTAHQAATAGRRVLLVDADPQGSASSWLLTTAPAWELADVLTGKATISDAVVAVAGLDLLATVAIGGGLRTYADNALEREPFIFSDLRKPSRIEQVTHRITEHICAVHHDGQRHAWPDGQPRRLHTTFRAGRAGPCPASFHMLTAANRPIGRTIGGSRVVTA